jgi:hypothetical protein
MNEWHDISEINKFKYKNSDFVVLVSPSGGGFNFTMMCSSISLIPKGALRFFIVPEDPESPEWPRA